MNNPAARFATIAFILASFSSWCAGSKQARADELRISTALSAYNGIFTKIAPEFEKKTGHKIVYVGSPETMSGVEVLKNTLEGKADASVASVPFEAWMKVMEKAHVQVPSNVTHRVIGKDLIHVVASEGVGVKELSKETEKGVFTGKFKNWKDLGGADLPITVVLTMNRPAGVALFKKFALDDVDYPADAKKLADPKAMLAYLAKHPGSVSFGTTDLEGPGVVMLKTPDVGAPTTMVTLGAPKAPVMQLIRFITSDGKRLGVH